MYKNLLWWQCPKVQIYVFLHQQSAKQGLLNKRWKRMQLITRNENWNQGPKWEPVQDLVFWGFGTRTTKNWIQQSGSRTRNARNGSSKLIPHGTGTRSDIQIQNQIWQLCSGTGSGTRIKIKLQGTGFGNWDVEPERQRTGFHNRISELELQGTGSCNWVLELGTAKNWERQRTGFHSRVSELELQETGSGNWVLELDLRGTGSRNQISKLEW